MAEQKQKKKPSKLNPFSELMRKINNAALSTIDKFASPNMHFFKYHVYSTIDKAFKEYSKAVTYKILEETKAAAEYRIKSFGRVEEAQYKKVAGRVAKNMRRGTVGELHSTLIGASKQVKTRFNKELERLAKTGNATVLNAQKSLKELYKDNGILQVTFANGAKVGADKYCNMVARTAKAESGNRANLSLADITDTKLVKYLASDITCKVCAQYHNRVFCIDGSDKDYPPLYDGRDAPYKSGYSITHPNCRCSVVPYYPDILSKQEVDRDKRRSKAPFTDPRSMAVKEQYQAWQVKNRQLRVEEVEYAEYRQKYGKAMPYRDLASFRRGSRSNAVNYQKLRYHDRDSAELDKLKSVIGDNAPKDLDKFQELKYTDSNKYELLGDYKKAIEKGDLTALANFDLYTTVKEQIQTKLVGVTATNGIEIKSQSKHFIDRVIGSVEQRRNGVSIEDLELCLKYGTPQEVQRNKSQKLILDGICGISINVELKTLIQCNPLGGGKNEKV